MSASSVPAPTCGVRCSPGTRLSTRRRTARSSERRTVGGIGPGPGRSGVRSGAASRVRWRTAGGGRRRRGRGGGGGGGRAPAGWGGARAGGAACSRQPPRPQEGDDRARQQEHERRAGERGGDLLL